MYVFPPVLWSIPICCCLMLIQTSCIVHIKNLPAVQGAWSPDFYCETSTGSVIYSMWKEHFKDQNVLSLIIWLDLIIHWSLFCFLFWFWNAWSPVSVLIHHFYKKFPNNEILQHQNVQDLFSLSLVFTVMYALKHLRLNHPSSSTKKLQKKSRYFTEWSFVYATEALCWSTRLILFGKIQSLLCSSLKPN